LDEEDPILLAGLHFGNARRNRIDDGNVSLCSRYDRTESGRVRRRYYSSFHQESRWRCAGFHAVKYWEIIADNLTEAGWSLGYVSAVDSNGRTIWIADAHRDDGKRFVVHADEKLIALLGLELVVRALTR
jgi:hypothetical protein